MGEGARKSDVSRRKFVQASIDVAIAELAGRQHAVVGLAQLVELGLTPRAVQHRAARAALHRVFTGVYSVVPLNLLSRKGWWMAAVLACGVDAVLSHRHAAALIGLRNTERRNIDVTVPRRGGRSRDRIQIHCSTTLAPQDIGRIDGIPCTSVSRTLLDLATVVSRRAVERAFDEADALELLDLNAVQRQLKQNPTHRAAAAIRAILAEHYIGSTPTRNELEEAFLAICRRTGVPQPLVNEWVDLGDGQPMIWADFVWRQERVIVETDGPRYHGTRQALTRDPRRDQRALVAGWRPMRAPWRQVMRRPWELEQVVPMLLNRAPAPTAPRLPSAAAAPALRPPGTPSADGSSASDRPAAPSP
jgi:predicted transcriptional regulator of viral defense system